MFQLLFNNTSSVFSHFSLLTSEEVQQSLMQLVMLNGFQSNPNRPGCEKLVMCQVQHRWLFKAATLVKSADMGQPGVAQPGSLFCVKGWNRCLACLGVLFAMYSKPEILKEPLKVFYMFLCIANLSMGCFCCKSLPSLSQCFPRRFLMTCASASANVSPDLQ